MNCTENQSRMTWKPFYKDVKEYSGVDSVHDLRRLRCSRVETMRFLIEPCEGLVTVYLQAKPYLAKLAG